MIFSFKLQKNNKGLVFVLFLALFAQFSHAQVSYLTGRVLDNSAELVGATVKVMKGLSLVRGVVTDIDGNFRIALDSGIYNLEVSYTGYKTQKIYGVEVISGQITTMKDIVMASPTGLSEAVVVGYSMSSPKKSKPAGGKTLSKGQYDKLAKRSAPANYATPEASKETHRKQKKQAEKNPAHQKETAIVAKNEPGTFQKTDTLIEPTPHESSAE